MQVLCVSGASPAGCVAVSSALLPGVLQCAALVLESLDTSVAGSGLPSARQGWQKGAARFLPAPIVQAEWQTPL